MNRRNWNAYCCDDLVSQRCTGGTNNEEIEREKKRDGDGGVPVCVCPSRRLPRGGKFRMEIYTPQENRVAHTRWGALALRRQAIGG